MRQYGVPMEQALDDRGCAIVRELLAALCKAKDKYGVIEVTRIINEFRNMRSGYYKKRSSEKRKWTKEKIIAARAMHDAGNEWSVVAEQFGCTGRAVQLAVSGYNTGRRGRWL